MNLSYTYLKQSNAIAMYLFISIHKCKCKVSKNIRLEVHLSISDGRKIMIISIFHSADVDKYLP